MVYEKEDRFRQGEGSWLISALISYAVKMEIAEA